MLKIVKVTEDPKQFGIILLNPSGYFHLSYFAIGFRDDLKEIYFKHVENYHRQRAIREQLKYPVPTTTDTCFYYCEFVEQIEKELYNLHDCAELEIVQALTGMLFFYGEIYGAFLAPVFGPPAPVLFLGNKIYTGSLKDCFTLDTTLQYIFGRRGEFDD